MRAAKVVVFKVRIAAPSFLRPSITFATGTKLKDAAGKRFRAGIVLYDGESSARFGEGLYAVPIRALWDMERNREIVHPL